jgi:hypothetical protein
MTMGDIPEKQFAFLVSPWASTFYDLVGLAQEDLLITSPFISSEPLKKLAEIISKKPFLRLHIVTNLAIDSLLTGSLDISCLTNLVQLMPSSKVTYLPSLHAKVYIADNKAAIITSGNLTSNGLIGNREYGVLLHNSADVAQVRSDLTRYAALGNLVPLDTLIALSQATHDLRKQWKRADKSINAQLRKTFEQHAEDTKIELLKARARGKTTHGIFCDTVLYLLEKYGSLSTVELHPLVQQIHPDLCDDTIDRIIDGVHFGKKWKHYVRNAQQALKRDGLIDFDGTRWFTLK